MELNTASKALRALARQGQYSSKRDTGFSLAVSWEPTAQGGAIVTYADGTCDTVTTKQLAAEAE